MIVRCPECTTGFELPVDKLPAKGAKVRCSKCSHTFRVRVGDSGAAEIFYKDGTPADPPTRELHDLFGDDDKTQLGPPHDSEVDEVAGDTTQFGAPGQAAAGGAGPSPTSAATDDENDKTQLGRPTAVKKAPSKSASADYNPFPLAGITSPGSGVALKKKKPEAPKPEPVAEPEPTPSAASAFFDEDEIDNVLGDGNAPPPGESQELGDPFSGAFDDEVHSPLGSPAPIETPGILAPGLPRLNEPEPVQRSVPTPTSLGPAPADEPPKPDLLGQVESDSANILAAQGEGGFFLGRADSGFESAADLVDPKFGDDLASFDPNMEGDVGSPDPDSGEEIGIEPAPSRRTNAVPPAEAARAVGRSAPPPSAASGPPTRERSGVKKAPVVANAPGQVEDWDVAPHRIGGSAGQRFMTLLLITLVVAAGFLGVVAYQSGGFVDFARFDHMIDVAFDGVAFKPREEWREKAPPAPEPIVEDPVRAKSVFAFFAKTGEDARVLVVKGAVHNKSTKTFSEVEARVLVYDKAGKVLVERTVKSGSDVTREAIEAATDAGKVKIDQGDSTVIGGASVPFAAVIEDVPAQITGKADVSYHVELSPKEQ